MRTIKLTVIKTKLFIAYFIVTDNHFSLELFPVKCYHCMHDNMDT